MPDPLNNMPAVLAQLAAQKNASTAPALPSFPSGSGQFMTPEAALLQSFLKNPFLLPGNPPVSAGVTTIPGTDVAPSGSNYRPSEMIFLDAGSNPGISLTPNDTSANPLPKGVEQEMRREIQQQRQASEEGKAK